MYDDDLPSPEALDPGAKVWRLDSPLACLELIAHRFVHARRDEINDLLRDVMPVRFKLYDEDAELIMPAFTSWLRDQPRTEAMFRKAVEASGATPDEIFYVVQLEYVSRMSGCDGACVWHTDEERVELEEWQHKCAHDGAEPQETP